MAAATYLLMRWMGSKAAFREILLPAVCLMPVPIFILGFSTLMNMASYASTGIVPLGNTALVPSSGWILYCCSLAARYLSASGLAGHRRLPPILPVAVMAAWNVLYAVSILSWPLLQNVLLKRALEGVFQ